MHDESQEGIHAFTGIFEHRRTSAIPSLRLCTAEVRGSAPLGSTIMEGSFLKHDVTKNGLLFELGVFDLDGTVLRRDLRITARTVSALDELRERGVRLVVATGRRFEGAREHAERLGFADEDPLICYGGSVFRRINGESLQHRPRPRNASVGGRE